MTMLMSSTYNGAIGVLMFVRLVHQGRHGVGRACAKAT
jgi:hypothetical protein